MYQFYTVQVVASPAWMGDPTDPLIWHFLIEARSETEALEIANKGDTEGMPARIVPRF